MSLSSLFSCCEYPAWRKCCSLQLKSWWAPFASTSCSQWTVLRDFISYQDTDQLHPLLPIATKNSAHFLAVMETGSRPFSYKPRQHHLTSLILPHQHKTALTIRTYLNSLAVMVMTGSMPILLIWILDRDLGLPGAVMPRC